MARTGTYRKQSDTFGPWLRAEIKAAGMTQGEFAARVGASKSSVSRWINGRVPEASFIDLIADVLVLDYDLVSEKAGYRPRLPREHIDALHARFDRYLLRLEDHDLAHLDEYLKWMADRADAKRARAQPHAPSPSSERKRERLGDPLES